jgi:hypothetical protein
MRVRVAAAIAGALAYGSALGCGKSAAPSASAPSAGSASGEAVETGVQPQPGDEGAAAPMDAREAAQWSAAREGDGDELARLADLVGCEGLVERATDAALRQTAIRAMQYCPDFMELPWLAAVAISGADEEAHTALDVIVEMAARPRRATDPEDAEELHAGCGALLDLAKDSGRPRDRRVMSIRALRMLAERGCVRRAEIPTDVDAR